MTPLPFITSNRSLAIALATAGAPIIQVMNKYTPQMLATWGFKTASQAVKAGRIGKVEFHFRSTPRLPELIKAFDYQQSLPKDEVFTIGDEVEDDIRAVRLVCHSQRIRLEIDRLLKLVESAWEETVQGNEALTAFMEKEARIRKKVADAVEKGIKDMEGVLDAEEIAFLSQPHSISVGGLRLMNATLKAATRRKLGA